jgi:hypothetical protein
MIKFLGPSRTTNPPPSSGGTQVTGFSSAYFLFGDVTGGNSGVGYNRTISFSTDSESARTANTGPRISQGAGGFSSTNIYHINGFQSGIITTKNKILAASDSQSTAVVSFTVERRGATNNLPHLTKSRIYMMGGYSDSLGQYRTDTTYITTSNDTATNATAITAARHVSVGMYESNNAYILGGYTTGNGSTNTIYKYAMNTDTASNTSITESSNMAQGYAFSNSLWGYRANGATVTNASNIKLTFATETKSTGTNSPEGSLQLFQGVASATATVGYVWTGYRNFTLNRAYHKLTFSTETWTNNSYTTGDTNSGWITSNSGA